MELKVWVDGIQRVVCGASYSTTCQDVVVALAHAMGRTGRFTLVEKWRDSERPLTPGECPLQALHKWGEYAAEVKFYLVQAETDKAKQQQQTKSRQKLTIEKLDKFTHNFTPPQSAHHPGLLGPESIKRSSTFSGAHNLNYAGFPSAPLSSSMSSTLSHYSRNQQPHNHTSASSKLRRTALAPLPNGEIVSASSSNSSPRSSSRSSPRDVSPASRGSASSSSHAASSSHRAYTYRGDARELHPANMPVAASSYSHQDRDSSAYKYSSHQAQPVPHQPSYSKSSQPVPHQPSYSASSQPVPHQPSYSASSQRSYPAPSRTSSSSQNYPPSSYQSSESVSSAPHPSSQHPIVATSSTSQQPYSHHNHPHPAQAQPVPAPRHQRTLSPSVEYENLPAHPRDKHLPFSSRRERSGERSSSRTFPVPPQTSVEDSSNIFYHGEDRTAGSIGDGSSYFYQHGGRTGTQPYQTNVNEGRRDQFQDQRGRTAHSQSDYLSLDRNTRARSRSNDRHLSEPSSMAESSNRNRFVPQPQISKGVPSRSFASTDSARSDGTMRQSGDNLSKSLPESSLNSQSEEPAGKLSFVESALMRQQRSSLESNVKAAGGGGGMSSFASAVAHLRQHSGDSRDAHLKIPKSETHVRQHSSDSSRTDESFQGGLGKHVSPRGLSSSNQNLLSSLNPPQDLYQPQQPPLSPSNRPASNFTSISPSRHNSAFTQVSPGTSRQGSSSSPSAPIAYHLDLHNFDNYGAGVGDRMAANPGKTQSNELSHSRQASLEVEEYDLDQNFPDVMHRVDGGGIGGAGVKMQMQRGGGGGMPLEYHLDEKGLMHPQDEAEYVQLVRLVRTQEDKLKMQEAQISDWTMEISSLEEKESKDVSELEVITREVSQLEETEVKVKVELEDLERVEWVNVLDGERKREADIKFQMKNLQEKFDVLENELRQLKEQEEKQTREVKEEREKIERENRKNEELDRKINMEVKELGEKLTSVDKQVKEKEKHLVELEKMIEEADTELKQQEKKVDEIEKDLKDENMKDFHAHPVPKEPAPSSVPSHAPVVAPASLTVVSGSDSGEAILKILEGRLSPRSPPTSPAADGDSSSGGLTSAQQTYKSAMAAKSPNGVWV